MGHPSGSVALAVALAVTFGTACTPLAVGSVVVGSTGVIAAAKIYEGECDGEGCIMGNVLAVVLGVVGLGLVTGGGLVLAFDDPGGGGGGGR